MEETYRERYRPQFHFTAQKGWLNDPNGLVFFEGEYHLFFQHNPFGTDWGNMTWGHAISSDLVHWKQIDNALEPDRLGTMFSGSAAADWENTAGFKTGDLTPLILIYTAAGGTSEASKGQPFTQCIAYSEDRGRSFKKYGQNPVLGHSVKENRDPKVAWHAPTRRWIMALYLDGNDYALYSSHNLKEWTHLQTFSMEGCSECPDFFEMPVEGEPETKRWVFTAANGRYYIGAFDGKRFTPETGPHIADHGANYYAVQTYSDIPASDGRRIQIAWMNGGKYPDMPFNQQMSFPCELTLKKTAEGLRLYRYPVQEIKALHEKPIEWKGDLKPGENPLKDASGHLFDIELEAEIGDASVVVLTVSGEEIRFNAKEKTVACLNRSAPLSVDEGKIKLRALADITSLEVFGNGGEASLTSCFVPKDGADSLSLVAEGGEAKNVSLKAYPLRAAWT
jgi:sucrose-6-phosphate hydrolase SacC (GH32 family)